MNISFIRHGFTAGNFEKRYIGTTDEPLSDIGVSQLKKRIYPRTDYVIASPMKRCIQTANIIYPLYPLIIVDDFRECGFGRFEGKNYNDLKTDEYYQKWIDSVGRLPFPDGELPDNFRRRCCNAFENEIKKFPLNSDISLIIHGGTIMSILSNFAIPKMSYFDYQVQNGCGFHTEWDGQKIIILSEFL